MTEDLIYIGVAILLPITPAYILYKALPSTAEAEGPFKGLKIKLGGAFAGYFLLVLVVISFFISRRPTSKYDVWEVTGTLMTEGNNSPMKTEELIFSLVPPNHSFIENGNFNLQIARQPGPSGLLKFPTLVIQYPNYGVVTLDLDKERSSYQSLKLIKDQNAKLISIDDPITLKKSDYQSRSQQPQPVDLSALEVKQ